MKIIKLIKCVFMAALLTAMVNIYPEGEVHKYSEQEKQTILSLVKPSPVMATINRDIDMRSAPYKNAKAVKQIKAQQSVEILKDRSAKWYCVLLPSENETGWLPGDALDIPSDPETNRSEMSREQLEGYVNIIGLKSDTEYLVWTDIDRQLTYVFKGSQNHWDLHKTIICTTGKNTSPTARGVFKAQERGNWFFSDRLNSGAKYWVRYHDTYLYHSVAMDRYKNITDGVLGRRQSSGCIRMSVDDAEWFYRTITSGSTIFIY